MGDKGRQSYEGHTQHPFGMHRLRLAQNFLRKSNIVKSIISGAGLNSADVVYEIGPGKGIITKELARVSGRVIAIEKDAMLAEHLRRKFSQTSKVTIIDGDFLLHKIETADYKIVSNLPFNISAPVLKRILFGSDPPKEALLILQDEVAKKYAGIPHSTEVSVLAYPRFQMQIVRRFRKTDFEPAPDVEPVLFLIIKRKRSLIAEQHSRIYEAFVTAGFRSWKRNLRAGFKDIFTYKQWHRLARHNHFAIDATPTQLTAAQWLSLFQFFLERVDEMKKKLVFGKKLSLRNHTAL